MSRLPSVTPDEQEQTFSTMVEKVVDYAVFQTDAEGTIRTWNKAAETMKGYSAPETIGCFYGMLYPDGEQHKGKPHHNLQLAAKNGAFQEQGWRRKKDGSYFWAAAEIIAIRGTDGTLTGFCKITRDISEHKALAEQLDREKERAQATLAAIGDAVISVGKDECIEFINPKAEFLTGRRSPQALGRPLAEVFRLETADEHGTPRGASPVLVTPEGLRYHIEHNVSVIHGRDGEDLGRFVVFRDVTQRRVAESNLKTADRRKDEFLAMLAHELRNPLAAMSAGAGLLGMSKLDAAGVKRTSDVLARQVKHMTGLIDDLLDVSRVTRGQVKLDKSPLDMNSVIADAVEQVRPLIEKRGHTLELELHSGRAAVLGDHQRLVQCVSNLLGNSAKYTDVGGHIRLVLEVQAQEVAIIVTDDGIGMSQELLGRAFQMFAQAEPNSERAQGGLGLGLALVKSLVEMHGGVASAHSAGRDRGSTVKIVLPRLAEPTGTTHQGMGPKEPTAELSRRILLVDDNEDSAVLLGEFLTAMGYEVLIEHQARAGLQRACHSAPGVCLLNIGLPDFDGFKLARLMRTQPETENALLIALTGFGQPQDVEKAHAAGFDHHFIKPINMAQLLSVLEAGKVQGRRPT